jgi:hypothetical protein
MLLFLCLVLQVENLTRVSEAQAAELARLHDQLQQAHTVIQVKQLLLKYPDWRTASVALPIALGPLDSLSSHALRRLGGRLTCNFKAMSDYQSCFSSVASLSGACTIYCHGALKFANGHAIL